MADDLDEEWWEQEGNAAVSEEEEKEEKKLTIEEAPSQGKKGQKSEKKTGEKRKSGATETPEKAAKKKKTAQKECFVAEPEVKEGDTPKKKRKRKKKTITDVLATSEPKAGCPTDLQNLVLKHFSDKRTVIELEDLKLPDSSFLCSNDLTHSLSSYLKTICPKWAKVQKQHTQQGAVVLLIVCSAALRTIELIKQLNTFKGEARVQKLFAKHIKVEEQIKLLKKGVTHIGVGTPQRLRVLIEKEGLDVTALRYLVLDWNWRDQKLRRMVDLPEVKSDLLQLLDSGIIKGCREGRVKVGLF